MKRMRKRKKKKRRHCLCWELQSVGIAKTPNGSLNSLMIGSLLIWESTALW
jgi:hypothetical protein